MFGRKVKNSAAALPLPQAQTVIQQPQHWGRIVAVAFACAVLGVVLGYLGIVALAADAGSENPRRDVAQAFLWIVCGGGVLYCASVAGSRLYVNIAATNHAHKVEIMDKMHEFQLEQARILRLAATTNAADTNDRLTNDSDYTKSQLAKAILRVAYTQCDDGRKPYRPNDARPWTRDAAYDLGVAGVTTSIATGIRGWMSVNGLIVGNQVNFAKYPDWEAARRMLAKKYAPAVLVNAHLAPLSDSDMYSVIDNVK